MKFSDVIGQSSAKEGLRDSVSAGRLSHALLFLGREGSGALPLASAFAQYLLCENVNRPSAGGNIADSRLTIDDSCGLCPSCQQAASIAHPDIHYSYPVITKKPGTPPLSSDYSTEWREFLQQMPYGNVYDWLQSIGAENKQGNITAAECNDIIRKLSLKSFGSGYKVLIMWMPEYLGKEGNKLLKLIEEPPPDTLFILVAENEAAILTTILSRCALVRVPAIEDREVAAALQQRAGCDAAAAQRLAGACEGNYREALHLLQHADEDFNALLRDWLNANLKQQLAPLYKILDELVRLGREKQKQLLLHFSRLVEQAVRLEAAGPAADAWAALWPEAERDFAARLNKAMTMEQKEAVASELSEAAYQIERNANARILFHALSTRLYHIVKHNAVPVLR